ncbi:hypothetical protein PMAYCL1PPCAC_02818 [Pristionchus mayeri]|uniref:Uncharacterized protein n=1 Tax=Pristionchus mayeri TaxID=1317129 RepID=A0AAN4Z635_9BILA|nr:hypothetical protein PMAYCL1PPCAC_02818 [Pristionchus mayeri]
MKDDEIAEIIKQVESNAGRSEQTSHKDDLDSSVRNISPDMFEKQQRIIKATRDLREHLDQQQKERVREQLLLSPEPSTTTEEPTEPPTYRPIHSTTIPTSSSFAEFETTTKVSTIATHRPLVRSTSALPLPFSSVQHPWAAPVASTPFAQVPLSSPSSSSFLYPSQLYSVSGQAIPPVQQVHPHLSHLPTHPPPSLPSPISPPFSHVALPPPPPSSLSSLPTYYTYQNANAHTVTRGTVQLPVSSMPHATRTRARRVRGGAGAASDPRVAAAAARTTVAPPRGQTEVSAAVQRRFKGRGEGMSGSSRRVEENHGGRRTNQVRAQAAKSHRIFASPLSTVSPSSSFPRRMVPTQPLTTPSPVRLPSPAAAVAPNTRRANQQQSFVVSADSRRSSSRPAATAAAASETSRTLVTPYWIDSNFVHRFPQTAPSPTATGDDLVRAEIAAANERMQQMQQQQQLNSVRQQLRPEEYRELEARLRQY